MKPANLVSLFALLTFQFLFISAIIYEQRSSVWAYGLAIIVVLLLVGAVVTYLLHTQTGMGTVTAACVCGLSGVVAAKYSKRSGWATAVYCGAFVGMSSNAVLGNVGAVCLPGVVAGFALLLSKNIFKGVGGKLGSVAFVGVAVTTLLLELVPWFLR